jgi:hypothetical protein
MTEAPVETPSTPHGLSRFQLSWLPVFWVGVGNATILFVIATVNFVTGNATIVNWITAGFGAVAVLLAALFAQRLARVRATDLWFVKGTSAGRVVAVGWVAVIPLIVGGAVISLVFDLDADTVAGPFAGLLGSLGAVALIAMIGPGYTEYREALHVTTGVEMGDEVAARRRELRRARR